MAEIKSAEADANSFQNYEQVLGLLQDSQQHCLGIVVSPAMICVKWYQLTSTELIVSQVGNMKLHLSTDNQREEIATINKLCEFIMAVYLCVID